MRSFVCGRAHTRFRIPKVCSVKTIETKSGQRNRAKARIKKGRYTCALLTKVNAVTTGTHFFVVFCVGAAGRSIRKCMRFFLLSAPIHTHKSYNLSAHSAWLDRTIHTNTLTLAHTHMLPFFSQWNEQSNNVDFLPAKWICMLRWLLILCWGKLDSRMWHTEKEVNKLKTHERCLRCACACISLSCVCERTWTLGYMCNVNDIVCARCGS